MADAAPHVTNFDRMSDWHFLVDRDDYRNTKTIEFEPASLEDGQVRVRVDAFGFTANNVTYAAAGDMIGYWTFFPAADLGDDGTNWGPVSRPLIHELSGDATLLAYTVNVIEDGGIYTLPAANSVGQGGWVIVELPSTFAAYTPTVIRAGADNIVDEDGNDTVVHFDTLRSATVRFVSDGSTDWEI